MDRDVIFVALTRPQTFLGVTYSVVVLNAIVTTELFLLLKSPWVLAAAILVHAAGWLACLREIRIFDIWMVKASKCQRVRTWSVWRCNSYRA